MKIGINYLKLKDIKPGTVLTIVEFSDIKKSPLNPTIFIHGKNKEQFRYSFTVGMERYCGQKFTVVKVDQYQRVHTVERHSFTFSLSMFKEIDPFDPEIIWGYYEVRPKK